MVRAFADSRAVGRALRDQVPRAAHEDLPSAAVDRDPVAILESQHASRLPDLVGVRIGRMLQTPFTYYRGTAAVMAHDLAGERVTGARVVASGDAHISNFGFFASPERRLLFDLNDFDEAGLGPWEWDVKRLAASVHVGGRDIGMGEDACRDATRGAVRGYREALREFYELTAVERYYARVDDETIERALGAGEGRAEFTRTVRKARRRTSDRVLEKIVAREEDGATRIVDAPPVTRHVDHATLEQLDGLLASYRTTLREDVALLLSQFRLVDYVLRVVGVGSVGTRCYVLLLEGPHGEALFLQAKEAQASVLVRYGGCVDALATPGPAQGLTQGQRVVAAQRILQAQSDPMLGWIRGWAGDTPDRPRVDYYWRQFRDMKGSVELDRLAPAEFARYGALCGRLLARAHSQSPGGAVVRAYLGRSERFDDAVATWARHYADRTEADHAALAAAAKRGRVPVEHGV